jgi:hypothetical protein
MLQSKILIKKDDKIKVIAGKDKGKIGKVLKVDKKKNRLLVEKINLIKRHAKPSAKNKQGGIVEGEAPVATPGRWEKDTALCKMRRSNRYLRRGAGGRQCHS